MGYRVETGESVDEAVRRIAREQIDKAIEDLGRSDRHEAVHEFRKRCKKLRALLRLVRPALGKTYKAENAWFRDSARQLSDLRDATSAVETCEALAERYRHDVPGDVFEPVRDELLARREDLAEEQDLEARVERCRDSMKAARGRVGSWRLDRRGFDAIDGGLRKTYKRARKAMQRARRESSTRTLHEWRKRVKYDRYHVRLLRDSWRPVLDSWRGQLHELSDLLGDDHDLAVFQQIVEDAPRLAANGPSWTVPDLIATRRAELQARAHRVGARLLAEKPGRFADRHRAYWEASRSQRAVGSTRDGAALDSS